jgi:tetratricopeptide (TPR) repeat protein
MATLVSVLWGRGNVALAAGDIAAVRANATEALEVERGLRHSWARARPLSSLGLAALTVGALDEAAARFEEAIPLYRELGDRAGLVITALLPRSGVAIAQKDMTAAEWYASEALAESRGTGWEAAALVGYGDVLFEMGDVSGARRFALAGLRVAADTGLENWFRMAVRDLARIALRLELREDAALLIGAARRNLPAYGLDPRIFGPTESRCRAELGDDQFERVASKGFSLTHDEIIDRAGTESQPTEEGSVAARSAAPRHVVR